MITDDELYRLAIILGSAAMVLIVIYHYLEVNATDNQNDEVKGKRAIKAGQQAAITTAKSR